MQKSIKHQAHILCYLQAMGLIKDERRKERMLFINLCDS